MTRIFGYTLEPESGEPQPGARVGCVLYPSTRPALQNPVATGASEAISDDTARWELNLLPTAGSGRVVRIVSIGLFAIYVDIPVAVTGGAGDTSAIDVSTLLVDPTTLQPPAPSPSLYLLRAELGGTVETPTGSQAKVNTHNSSGTAHTDIRALIAGVASGAQPLDSDLTAIAALDASQTGVVASDGSGWLRKTYSALKTALSLVKADVGLGSVDNTADASKPVSTAQQTALNLKQDTSAKGAASGYASLDSGIKVPIAQLPTGSSSSTVAIGNDSRLSDARTPTLHKTTHAVGGSDALSPGDIGAAVDLPEFSSSAQTAAVGTPADMLAKLTRFDTTSGAISQPFPAATAGAVLSIGWDAGANALTLTAAGLDVFGSGSTTSVVVPLLGEVITYHCTNAGRWRVTGGFKTQSSLDGRFTQRANNLSDVVDVPTSRSNLGLGQFVDRGAVANSTSYNQWDIVTLTKNVRVLITTPVTSSSGGFISSVNYVVLSYLSTVDIRTFGAAVDGATDDTTAIQNAINSFGTAGVSTSGQGGIVYFPPGITRISAALDLPSNVHLMGAGASASVIQLLPNSNCHMITTHRSTGSGNSNAFWCSIRDLMLDGRKDNQGTILADVTLTPASTTVTSAAGTFAANGTLIQGVGILPGTTITSGGGTGSIVLSQAATIAALQQTPGAGTVYQGGTTDRVGAVIPWCAIYHETNPYTTAQSGDNQFDPTHLFKNLRIYFMCGDGIRVHGRSDVLIDGVKVSFPVGNGFTVDFDTKLSMSTAEKPIGHGLELPAHSSNQVSACKFYNTSGYGVYIHGGTGTAGELALSSIDVQQSCLSGLRMETQQGVIFDGTVVQAGFSSASSSGLVPSVATWQASHAYNNFRSAGQPSLVVPTVANGHVYACYTAGTSAGSEPTWPTTNGVTVTDGGVTWVCLANSPAAVSLSDASNCIVTAVAQNDLNALRITGTSTKNAITLAHVSTITGKTDVSSDSVTLLASGNQVVINATNLTATLAALNDLTLSTLNDGQILTYQVSTSKWINANNSAAAFYSGLFGDGSDGVITLDGVNTYSGITKVNSTLYSLTRDIYPSALTVNSGITLATNGGLIYCTGTVTNNGTISADGGAATTFAGASAPASGAVAGSGTGKLAVGGAGNTGAGSNGIAGSLGVGAGGAGGTGSSGASGTGGTVSSSTIQGYRRPEAIASGTVGIFGSVLGIVGGGGGGGGGGDGTNRGGGGGEGGAVIAIFAHALVSTGAISAKGGNGFAPVTGNCGGGGGGGGGLIISYTLTPWTNSGTTAVTGGTGGAGVGTGTTGSTGASGQVANIVLG
jgi:hypothetical protein